MSENWRWKWTLIGFGINCQKNIWFDIWTHSDLRTKEVSDCESVWTWTDCEIKTWKDRFKIHLNGLSFFNNDVKVKISFNWVMFFVSTCNWSNGNTNQGLKCCWLKCKCMFSIFLEYFKNHDSQKCCQIIKKKRFFHLRNYMITTDFIFHYFGDQDNCQMFTNYEI